MVEGCCRNCRCDRGRSEANEQCRFPEVDARLSQFSVFVHSMFKHWPIQCTSGDCVIVEDLRQSSFEIWNVRLRGDSMV